MTLTEEQAIELGKRAVAAGWPWMPGMLLCFPDLPAQPPLRLAWKDTEFWYVAEDGRDRLIRMRHELVADEAIPNFRDAPTMGWLLALVREVHRDSGLVAIQDDFCWWLQDDVGEFIGGFVTEAHALVSAWECAWYDENKQPIFD